MTETYLAWVRDVCNQEYDGDLTLFTHEVNSI